MRRNVLLGLGLLLLVGSALLAANDENGLVGKGPAAIVSVKPNPSACAAFGKFELAVDLNAECQNPFDPADVALEGHFISRRGRAQLRWAVHSALGLVMT